LHTVRRSIQNARLRGRGAIICGSSRSTPRSPRGSGLPWYRSMPRKSGQGHHHYCDYAGHYWQCSGDCECCCGLPMEENDHSECPVELRACPEHEAEAARSVAEAMASEPAPSLIDKWQQRPHCECGCAEAESNTFVGWCLHCTHVYVDYSPEIEDLHFAKYCPGAPEELKESARERLA
jgi:hypothetical protein